MNQSLSCSCLCGKTKFSAVPHSMTMDSCHCSMCRKWSGGALLAVHCDEVNIQDGSPLGIYASSDWGERVFCSNCGTNLMWRMRDGSVVVVMAQAFDDPSQFEFTTEIYIDEKPDNYSFANQTKKMTGEEFLAQITSEGF